MTNKKTVNVVVPAAGKGSRFANQGWKKPKPLIDVDGKTMLERVVDNISPSHSKIHLLLNKHHILENPISAAKLSEVSDEIIEVTEITEGTACSVLLAKEYYNNNLPMMVANSDQVVDFDVNDFIEDCFNRDLDGSILVFRDPEKNPKWSFARLDPNGLVEAVAEKIAISDLATVGIYLFSKGSEFILSAEEMIENDDRVNNEFYTCPVYNYMIRKGAKIGIYEIPSEAMHGIGTPEDLDLYLDSIKSPRSIDRPECSK